MTAPIEVFLSWLLKNQRNHEDKSFYTNAAFAPHGEQTIEITSPELGASPAELPVEFTHDGTSKIPALEWMAPPAIAGQVREWLLLCEDVDVPLPVPIAHGIYMGIPGAKTSVEHADFDIADPSRNFLKGGFYCLPWRGRVYIPPRPLMNHGPHRYYWQIIALSEPLDEQFNLSKPSKKQIAEAIVGKVLGWGLWVGQCERRWT